MQLVTILAAAGLANAANHVVAVGREGLRFSPETITAQPGDTVEFRFYAANHSVVAAQFRDNAPACSPATQDAQFWSGYFPTEANTVNQNAFVIRINDTQPIPFYCSQGRHCPNGMVGVINPAGGATLDAYKADAAGEQSVSAPSVGPFGGSIMRVNGTAPSVTSSGSNTPTPPPSASSSSAASSSSSTAAAPRATGAFGGLAMAAGAAALFL